MNSLVDGGALAELTTMYPTVEFNTFGSPLFFLTVLMVSSVSLSLLSASYYFKLYMLMSPQVTAAEVRASTTRQPQALMVHDVWSLTITVVLIVLLLV
jgi:fumarate reductase subunit C